MDRSSYFIKDRGLFGSYPTQEGVNELEREGVRYFIDLTLPTEKKIIPYTTQYNYISYPIKDRQVPESNWEFASFIIQICNIIKKLKNPEKVYIHCKGGHGRSGVVVAIILSYIFSLSPMDALFHTTVAHSQRKLMKDKWRHIGAPQTCQQKSFVFFFCKSIKFYKTCKNTNVKGFSNFSLYPVEIPYRGCFFSAEAALKSYKSDDPEYIAHIVNCKNYYTLKLISNNVKNADDYINPKLLFRILKLKFDQHRNLKSSLLNTYLSPLIYDSKTDLICGTGGINNSGKNLLGKLLCKLRQYYLLEHYTLPINKAKESIEMLSY